MKRFLILFVLVVTALEASAQLPTKPYDRIEDVVYGRKFGTALTLDVWKPKSPNGKGVIFIMSGGWISDHLHYGSVPFVQWYPRLVDAGFTVFTVIHGSQPRFAIPEIIPDLERAIQFVKANASTYGVKADELGLTGGSAGGHLTLMLTARPKEGNPNSNDPVAKQNTRVKAAAVFFPPTDFLNYDRPGDVAFTNTLKGFSTAFGPRIETPAGQTAFGKEFSPIYHVTKDQPPTLLIHGDADRLVPYYQADVYVKRAKELGVDVQLIRRPGLAHGWPDYSPDMREIAEWFSKKLAP